MYRPETKKSPVINKKETKIITVNPEDDPEFQLVDVIDNNGQQFSMPIASHKEFQGVGAIVYDFDSSEDDEASDETEDDAMDVSDEQFVLDVMKSK